MVKKKESKTKKSSKSTLSSEAEGFFPANPEERKALKSIFTILLKSSRVDFFHYRHTTILRRLSRRMALCKQDSYADYLNYLQNNIAEVEQLYDDLLLSYTHFFRDPHVFEALKKTICPQIVKDRSARTPIRIWVPGCSSGEEVYSLAICLYEFLEESKSKVSVQFFGTDLVERHITKARLGLYPDRITKEVSKERLEKFFDKTSQGWKVTKHIREMCVFAIQNIAQDPPFSNIDLVSCRNVLIYFDTVFLEIAIPLFHFSLKPSGFLLLGTSETMGRFPQFFNVIDQKINLYSKRIPSVKPDYKFPVYPTFSKLRNFAKVRNTTGNSPVTVNGTVDSSEVRQQINNILLDNYTPPGVLIDSNMQISQFVGHIFPYLGPVSGEASLKLSKMVGEGLMPDLYVAIEEVKKKKEKIRKRNISFKQNGKVILTDISVIPVLDPNTEEASFLILFEKPESPQTSEISNVAQQENANDELSYLKQELQLTKEHLQSIIEEKDEVNQELWSANEEVQSTNEELQSVNEEMEAAKEELESTNEELLALNEELQTKNIELTASKEFAVNLLETANTIVLTLDSNAMITTFNRYAEELTGYKKEDVIGKNWFDIFIPSEDQEQVSKVINSALKHIPEASLNENCIVVKSGMERMISWHNNVLRDGAGKVIGLLSVGMDITEHKLAEEALKEAYEINKMIISESPIGIAIYDESGQCISANKSIGEIIGTTTEQVLKQNYNEIKSWKESGLLNTAKDAVKEGVTQRKGVQITSTFEKVLSIDCYFVPFQEKGKTKLMFMITDISAHKQAEIEKIKAQQYAAGQEKQALVGQVAGKIAHDFNNILGVIMGNAELSLMECDDLEIKKTLELIFEQTIQGKNLTKNLVAFAKDQELKQEFFNINKKINLVLDLLKRDVKRVEVVKDFEADLPNLLADSGMIEHAIVNLIQNSIHALGKADCPRIFIRTYCIDDSWVEENYIEENICIEIEDNGCGIPEEHLDNIYLPSFTLKGNKDRVGSYAKDVKGTGYGMSNIKKYVEQHKGTIAVESEFGMGTKFIICLPVTKKELTKKEKEEISKLKSQFGKNILLVEDEPAIADIQHRILTHKPCNHKVDIANDGKLAIELLKRNNYDFISLDYVLPGNINGMDVYNYIRETDKIIPILFISGNIEFLESIKELKQKDTNIDHLSKPCQNKEYLSSINELLERTMA